MNLRALALASAAFAALVALLGARRAQATTAVAEPPSAGLGLMPALGAFATPLGMADLFSRSEESQGPNALDADAPNAGELAAVPVFSPLLPLEIGAEPLPASSTPGPVPKIRIPANKGQTPMQPPDAIYRRFPATIDAFVRDVNSAAAGLRIGLNSWWREVDSGIGEELSQHLIGVAIDFQGPDQEEMARRLRAKGYIVLDRANDGTPYKHRHAQRERAGYLMRLGVTPDALRRWLA